MGGDCPHAVRKVDLALLLINRGYRLLPLDNGIYRVRLPQSSSERPDPSEDSTIVDLLVKRNYWTWPDRDLAGNTIDFLVNVENKTFRQGMEIILACRNFSKGRTVNNCYNSAGQHLREDRGNVPDSLR